MEWNWFWVAVRGIKLACGKLSERREREMKPKSLKMKGIRTIFRYRLARYRGQILGWGLALALLGLFMAQFYGTIAAEADRFEQLLASYPKELMAFFGDTSELTTSSGYLNLEYFVLMPLILGIFMVLTGSGLLAADEESGRLDLIMAHPVSRTSLYWGRVLAFALATLSILLLAGLGLYVPSSWTPLDVGWLGLMRAFVSLFAVLMLFGALALLLSLLLPSRRLAAMVTGILLVGSYFVTSLARVITDLETVAKLSPLNYYQGGDAIESVNITWAVGLLATANVFAVLAWWRFEKRDIRVGGEGGWQRPELSSLSRVIRHRASGRREVPATEGGVAGRQL
jgi:ABC-2 type transport system permease protein